MVSTFTYTPDPLWALCHGFGSTPSNEGSGPNRGGKRPQRAADICARSGGCSERAGMGTEAAVFRPNACVFRVGPDARWFHTRIWRLPTRQAWSAHRQRSKQESAWSSVRRARRMRAAHMGGRLEDPGLPVGGRTRHGGSYGVRGSAWELKPRAWQRVPWRLRALDHVRRSSKRGWNGHGTY